MRKIIASINITLDGFMAGPHYELDWHFPYWTEEMAEFTGMELQKADTILLGRVTYEAMANHWSSANYDLSYSREDLAIAELMNNHAKIVFSRTLSRTNWNNSRIGGSDLQAEVYQLKNEPGENRKNILLFGSHSIARALQGLNLIDEYILWVHPVFVGRGKALFHASPAQRLGLLHSRTFRSGVVLLRYETAGCSVLQN